MLDGPAPPPFAADLYLATACAVGDPTAATQLRREYLGAGLRSYLGRLAVDEAMLDELRQTVLVKLLGGHPPRIARYNGSGPMGAWVRVITARTALDLLREQANTRGENPETALAASVAAQVTPENALARTTYGPVFQAALERALAALPPRDQAILKFHFLERLSIDAVGTIYRVHRATVARWLADIRRRLSADIEERLQVDLGTTPSEFRSLLEVVRDDLRASLARVLGP